MVPDIMGVAITMVEDQDMEVAMGVVQGSEVVMGEEEGEEEVSEDAIIIIMEDLVSLGQDMAGVDSAEEDSVDQGNVKTNESIDNKQILFIRFMFSYRFFR